MAMLERILFVVLLSLSLAETQAQEKLCDLFGCNCENGYNDGCNDCFCEADGTVKCTKKFCLVLGQPFCKPDCSQILCLRPDCDDSETEITPPGECCPICVPNPDCSLVLCAEPVCEEDERRLSVVAGECCPKCIKVKEECSPDDEEEEEEEEEDNDTECTGLLFDCKSCENGYNDGCNECSCDDDGNAFCTEKTCGVLGQPFCKPDCSQTLCPFPTCEDSEKRITPPGECCPICVPNPDCSLVLCALPDCGEHEIVIVPDGECCPVCFEVGYDCEVFAGGDPHFKTMGGHVYDYHGECDLVMLEAPEMDLRIHIRTTLRHDYSFISSASVKIGEDTLQVSGWGEYLLNGVWGGKSLPSGDNSMLSGHRFSVERNDKKHHVYLVELGEEHLRIMTFKDWVTVSISGGSMQHLGVGARGMLGSYPHGSRLARDGQTLLNDPLAFGAEWQVRLDTDPMLFETARAPQYPESCRLPSASSVERRRLGASTVSQSEAEAACSHWRPAERPLCVADVMASGDVEVAQAGSFS